MAEAGTPGAAAKIAPVLCAALLIYRCGGIAGADGDADAGGEDIDGIEADAEGGIDGDGGPRDDGEDAADDPDADTLEDTVEEPPAATWIMAAGGGGYDTAFSVAEVDEGSIIVAGETSSFGTGNTDMILVKMDGGGNVLWQKTIGGDGFESALGVIGDAEGGLIVVGKRRVPPDIIFDAWIMRLDGGGDIVWQKTVGGNSDEWAGSAAMTGEGSIVVAGETRSYYATAGDMLVMKLDPHGEILWQKHIGGHDNEHVSSLATCADGSIIAVGSTRSFGAGEYDMWIVKLDDSGNVLMQETLGGSSNDLASSVIESREGDVVIAGGTVSFGEGNGDMWIVRLDSVLEVSWQKTIGAFGGDVANALVESRDGRLVVAGQSNSSGYGEDDMWLAGLDRDGSVLWHKGMGGSGSELVFAITGSGDGGIVAAGNTGSFGEGRDDMWLVKTIGAGWIDGGCSIVQDVSAVSHPTAATPRASDAACRNAALEEREDSVTVKDCDAVMFFLCPE